MMRSAISILILSLLISGSCKKDKVDKTYIPAYLEKMVPYKNNQTINFITTNGGILPTSVTVSRGFTEKSNCVGCAPYAIEEYANYEFKDGVHPFIRISIDVRPNIFMNIFSPADNYQIGNGFDFLTQEGSPQFLCNGPRQTCLSSIVLNGTTFTNVLEIISGASGPNDLVKAYYTVEKGLVGFKYGNGYTFSLKE